MRQPRFVREHLEHELGVPRLEHHPVPALHDVVEGLWRADEARVVGVLVCLPQRRIQFVPSVLPFPFGVAQHPIEARAGGVLGQRQNRKSQKRRGDLEEKKKGRKGPSQRSLGLTGFQQHPSTFNQERSGTETNKKE